MSTIISHVTSGFEHDYIGKIIHLSAIVSSDVERVLVGIDPETQEDLNDTIFLETNEKNIYFWITHDAHPPKVMDKYGYELIASKR